MQQRMEKPSHKVSKVDESSSKGPEPGLTTSICSFSDPETVRKPQVLGTDTPAQPFHLINCGKEASGCKRSRHETK
ncbi:hypothetical protein NQZ68_031101 [Dissostichus eleginoides]|nr:hypothetical protein NQZ68_031101 [Dissostichus eleginoides]